MRVLEPGDDVAIVLGEIKVADVVGKSDAGVTGYLAQLLVAKNVPDDDNCVLAVLVRAAEQHSFAVVHHAAGRAQLVAPHV